MLTGHVGDCGARISRTGISWRRVRGQAGVGGCCHRRAESSLLGRVHLVDREAVLKCVESDFVQQWCPVDEEDVGDE